VTRYYSRPVPGTAHREYLILRGHTVVASQVSRPDGQEVPCPPDVSFAIRTPAADRTPVGKRFLQSEPVGAALTKLAADKDRARARGIARMQRAPRTPHVP
jgi:hypothetical protein